VNKRLQPTGETVVTKQGICHKYQISEQNRYGVNDEVPSGVICDVMDILYVLEMNLAFLCGINGENCFL